MKYRFVHVLCIVYTRFELQHNKITKTKHSTHLTTHYSLCVVILAAWLAGRMRRMGRALVSLDQFCVEQRSHLTTLDMAQRHANPSKRIK